MARENKEIVDRELCERKRENSKMSIPIGYVFMPTDEELVFYLGRKSNGLPLPCDTVIEREIYGDGNKAPWQVFTGEDPWKICKTKGKNGNLLKTESTIYVLTTLIKASKNRIARTAGCGVWHAETALEQILDDHGLVIGYKRTPCFQVTNEAGVMDEDVKKSHWIMHEYSLGQRKQSSKEEYVLCRIKKDDSKFTKKRIKNFEAASTYDDIIVPKPAKRARKEFVQEQSFFMMCDEPKKLTRQDLDEGFASLDEPVSVMEQQESLGLQDLDEEFASLDAPGLALEQQECFGFEDLDESELAHLLDEPVYALEQQESFRLQDLDESALAFHDEPVSALEQQESFGLQDCGLVSVPETVLPPNSSQDDLVENLPFMEILSSAELLPRDQESDRFLSPNSSFRGATAQPSPISSVSSSGHVQLDPEILWQLKNMSWPKNSFPQHGYGGEIDVLQNVEWN